MQMAATAALWCAGGTYPGAAAAGDWTDHGVAVPLAERRGVVTCRDSAGRSLVIACSLDLSPRGWLLVTDIDDGTTEQIFCPDGVANSPPYGSLMAANGRFYTSQGKVLLELDPSARQWTFHGIPSQAASCYLVVTEGPDGTVWAGNAYTAGLVSFDPANRESLDHGRLDPVEKYLSYVAVDDAGWVYGGIGTQRCNIVAYDPATGEKRQIVPEQERAVGTATVYRGTDGAVYAKATLTVGVKRYRLVEGVAEQIEAPAMGDKATLGAIGWGTIAGGLPDGRRVTDYDMIGKYLVVQGARGGTPKRIEIDYESEGSLIRVLTRGPNGRVHGNSAHPSRAFEFDPGSKAFARRPGAIARKGLAVQGPYVIGGHYGGGKLYVHDTREPWRMAAGGASLRDGIGARDLAERAKPADGRVHYLEGHDICFLRGESYGASAAFDVHLAEPGDYRLIVLPYRSPGYCTVQFTIDERPVGKPFHGRAAAVGLGDPFVAGPVVLAAGHHAVGFTTLDGEAVNPWFGLRALSLTRAEPDEVVSAATAPNPELVATFAPDINVPWGACAHPDGEHVLISGMPGYGHLGGGIGVYSLRNRETELLKHDQLVVHHSVTAMAPLVGGDILCGTSVAGGHGTNAAAKEARLFVLDWATRTVSWRRPAPGNAREVGLLVSVSGGLVIGTADTMLFAFDPATREIVHHVDIKEFGPRAVNGMAYAEDGYAYLACRNAVLRVRPSPFEVLKLADAPGPINGGLAVTAGRVYVAVASHLWSLPTQSVGR